MARTLNYYTDYQSIIRYFKIQNHNKTLFANVNGTLKWEVTSVEVYLRLSINH